MVNVTSNSMTIQSQLSKIKIEEEQELWISEEELYIGSSSDEEYKTDREGLLCDNVELLEDDWKDSTDTLNVDTEGEYIEKEISEVKNLDNIIRTMNIKVKRACEETLFCQRENRKRLEQILRSNPSESLSGRITENTQQFFQLCPEYTKLNSEKTERNETSESYALVERNESKKDENENDTSTSNTNNEPKYDWEFINTDDYIETVNDPMEKSDPNPYTIIGELKDILLDVEKSIIVIEKNYADNMGKQTPIED